MNNKIVVSTHTSFQKLKSVILGQTVSENFFDWVADDRVKKPLDKIVRETIEDLRYFKKVLQGEGVKVLQPDPLEYDKKLLQNKDQLPVPPLQPRDAFLTLGNKCYFTNDNPVYNYITDYVDSPCMFNLFDNVYNNNDYQNGWLISGSTCYKVGKRVIFNDDHDKAMKIYFKTHLENLGYEVIIAEGESGHIDGCMSVIKPGVILSVCDVMDYKDTFPGWDVLNCEDQGWKTACKWNDFKRKVNSRWWIEGEENNDNLIDFVNTWLDEWVGYVDETVFDVNVFSISEDLVCVNKYNKSVFDFLKKHKVEPVIVPLRHKWFWDGGLHCITLDLEREGKIENYFK